MKIGDLVTPYDRYGHSQTHNAQKGAYIRLWEGLSADSHLVADRFYVSEVGVVLEVGDVIDGGNVIRVLSPRGAIGWASAMDLETVKENDE